MAAPVAIVVNPRSAGGRTGNKLRELETLARERLGDVSLWTTEGLGDGARQAVRAAEAGAELVVACGGDGTASEVAAGLLSLSGSRPAFGLLPAGTGSDLARTLGMPRTWPAALDALRDGVVRPTDAMKGRFTSADGQPVERFGINVIGMGLAGDVVRRVNASSKRLGGTLSFLGATIGALLAWRPVRAQVRWTEPDGTARAWSGLFVNVFVGNGSYCGSGMCVGPRASMQDGVLEVVIVPSLPLFTMAREFPRLYDGRLPDSPHLISGHAVRVEVEIEGGAPVPSDLDGEQPGWLPASVEVLPGALQVRAPWRARSPSP